MQTIRAGIDIGTNTILLLIAEIEDNRLVRVLRDEVRVVRLGEGVDENRVFSIQAMQRAEACFQEFATLLKEYKVDACNVAATSGSRDAANAQEFFQRIESLLGYRVEIISGEAEAEYSFRGALSDQEFPEAYAIVDIGGGSTEFVASDPRGNLVRHSFDVGCVRMKERFLASDPATEKELSELRQYVASVFKKEHRIWRALEHKKLVGVAGTATYLSAVNLGLKTFSVDRVDHSNLSLPEVQALGSRLARLKTTERLGLGGMDRGRADVIHAGAIILEEAMLAAKMQTLQISVRGLRYGLILV